MAGPCKWTGPAKSRNPRNPIFGSD